MKAGTFDAAIWIVSPVCGLRPERALLSRTSKVPNPVSVTFSPDFNVDLIVSKTAFTAASASFFESSAVSATLVI